MFNRSNDTVFLNYSRHFWRFVCCGWCFWRSCFAGIDAGDELLAIDGIRVGNQLNERLKNYRVNDSLEVTVFHQDELRTYAVTLAVPVSGKYQLQVVENPSAMEMENFAGWLGVPLTSIQ